MGGAVKQRKQSMYQVERSRQKEDKESVDEERQQRSGQEKEILPGRRQGLAHPAETLPGYQALILLPSVDLKD